MITAIDVQNDTPSWKLGYMNSSLCNLVTDCLNGGNRSKRKKATNYVKVRGKIQNKTTKTYRDLFKKQLKLQVIDAQFLLFVLNNK